MRLLGFLIILNELFILNFTKISAYAELPLTDKEYSQLFRIKRNEQKSVIRPMLKSTYEKKYKLLEIGYSKFFKIVRTNNATLNTHGYDPMKHGFDRDFDLQEIIASTIENCCIACESLLHFPDISYRIFHKTNEDWKITMNWCISFVGAFKHIIDESTSRLLNLVNQEINEELRTEDYINPYAEKEKEVIKTKQRKKLKKGPHLSGGGGDNIAIKHKEL